MKRTAVAGALAMMALVVAPQANADARPCTPPQTVAGSGSQGTPFVLRAGYQGVGQVAEEFEINTAVSDQVWTIQFSDNGVVFFSGSQSGSPVVVVKTESVTGTGGHNLGVRAVNTVTHEVIEGNDPLPPPGCGGH
ncbi:hypothetical protein [Actinokineospora inagensis]|uniref:hypothetical protein n=1 Tax=Actinokineospora inagensis TaxID=103730 RepID=UPI0004214032|nr:hypothetical protein [Actinokineospora inagensis]